MSDGIGEPRTEAEGELALARLAIDDGEITHAAAHAANALAADPSLIAIYAFLDELTATGEDLYPLEAGNFVGTVAARAHIAARAGDADGALLSLAMVTGHDPDQPWAAGGWLARPEFAAQLDPGRALQSLGRLTPKLADPVAADGLAPLRPYLELARNLVALHPDDHRMASFLSALARRIGGLDDAIAWGERAEQAAGSVESALMLGYAYRSAGRRDDMYAAWMRACSRDPGNIAIQVDIAEHLSLDGRRDEALPWLERAVAAEPGHPIAYPSICEMRFGIDGDVEHLITLVDHWRTHPEHVHAANRLTLACYGRSWLNTVPGPGEATSNMIRNYFAGESAKGTLDRDAPTTVTVNGIEPPSAVAAAFAALPNMTRTVTEVFEPDLRIPLVEPANPLWTYVGTDAIPVPSQPSAEALLVLHRAAAALPRHPIEAYDGAVGFSVLSLDDLRSLLSHVPPLPDHDGWRDLFTDDPVYWPRHAQAWTCVGFLHYRADEPWLESARRAALVEIVNGVEDWTTDAAMYALVVAAWNDPTARADVAEIVGFRFLRALETSHQRDVTILASMADLVLVTPSMEPDVAALARMALSQEATADQQQ